MTDKISQITANIVTALLLAISSAVFAHAASAPRLIGSYGNWQVVTFFDGGSRACAMNNQAVPSEQSSGDAYLFITNWPERKEYLAISARAQILLDNKRSGWLIFPDDSRFSVIQSELYVRPQPENRVAILRMLRAHGQLQMVNYNAEAQEIRANFDLKGIDAALAALVRHCPLPR